MSDKDRLIEILKGAKMAVQKEFAAARNLILRGKEVPWLKRNMYEIEADYLLENDVVPVVRCKACKYWCDKNGGFCEYENGLGWVKDKNKGFCSYGVPREESEVE